MRVVQRLGNSGDNPDCIRRRHPRWKVVAQQARSVGAVDVIHGNPQPALTLAAIVDFNDVRVPQLGGEVGFASEPFKKFRVGRHVGPQHFEGVKPGQPGMLRELHLTHPSGTEQAHDRKTREDRTLGQRNCQSARICCCHRLPPANNRGWAQLPAP